MTDIKRPMSSDWLIAGGEMGDLIRSTDWANTPLGPRECWPLGLRTVVSLVVESRLAMAVLWGRELILLYNDAYRGIAADQHPRALGRSAREIWPEVSHIDEHIFAAVLERGETIYLEDQLFPIHRRGCREDACFTLCCSPVRGEDGAVAGSLVTLLETTHRVRQHRTLEIELREQEEVLRAANEQLEEADRRKNEFLAVLSHELRNPLAPIRAAVHLLDRAPPDGERATRARQVIDRQVQHMARLLDDLLNVTRISRGTITLQRERVDLCTLARRTVEDYREIYARSGIDLEVQDPREPLHVDGDPTRLAQVIGNLLHNSARFTPRGGKAVISVEAGALGEALVRVRDNGAGMSPETLAHIFEPFAQAAQALDRSRGGLGLGLALVKGLVELHGGTVEAHSDGEGKGSEVRVALPLASPPRPAHAVAPTQARSSSARRVLVVEDNADVAETLREALEIEDHEVAVASSGPAGVEVARAYRPDVILCDIGLPGMDGYGVARALRADPEPGVRSTFLVALSGYALQEDILKSKEAGFDRHMAKPASIEAIERLLAEAPARAAAG